MKVQINLDTRSPSYASPPPCPNLEYCQIAAEYHPCEAVAERKEKKKICPQNQRWVKEPSEAWRVLSKLGFADFPVNFKRREKLSPCFALKTFAERPGRIQGELSVLLQ